MTDDTKGAPATPGAPNPLEKGTMVNYIDSSGVHQGHIEGLGCGPGETYSVKVKGLRRPVELRRDEITPFDGHEEALVRLTGKR